MASNGKKNGTVDLSRYRVKPGSRVDLTRWDPTDKPLTLGDKARDLEQIAALGKRLAALQNVLYAEHRHKILIVLQGMDTSGKDGTIGHVFSQVDPMGVEVKRFGVPTAEELDHDFLWRAHRVVPGRGEIAIFNRSHYEDVLVVRVHKLIDDDEARRRMRHIIEFERMLVETGTTILKLFLHISKDEQKARLQARLDDPEKRWKFQYGDVEERRLWDAYQVAYADALAGTSTEQAPWTVVPADSKTSRNLMISTLLVNTLESLEMKYPQPDKSYAGLVIE